MVRKKSSRKNLGRKNNGQSYFCKCCNISVKKIHCHEQSRKHINAMKKHSQYDNQPPNIFRLREVCVRTTNSQVFESESNRTEISPTYQSVNAETMSIERVRECNQSVRTLDNNGNIQHKHETKNSTYFSGDYYLTTTEATDKYSAHNENISIGIESEYSSKDNHSFRTRDDDEESHKNNKEDLNDEFQYDDHESYESDDTNSKDMYSNTESDLSDTIHNTTENDNGNDDDACLKNYLRKPFFG